MSSPIADRSGITLTYAGPESLLDSSAFGQLLSAFSSHLPLRNLHWKPSSVQTSQALQNAVLSPIAAQKTAPGSSFASIRTIQTLNTRLEPLSDTLLRTKLKPETRHLVQRNLLERPFCHLYFVIGDDSDAYRSHIRNDIRAWLGTIQGTPTLSAATITARAFHSVDQSTANGASTPRSATPPVRPETPTRSSTSDDHPGPTATSSKEKPPPTSPEYLIVVITPPDGTSLALPSTSHSGRASPVTSPGGTSTPTTEAPRTGLQRFYSSSKDTASSSSTKAAGVVEKVKADFNTARKERVVHLTRLPDLSIPKANQRNHSDPTIFAELTSRIKESVASTFDAVVGMQDDAVRKELTKKEVPGWNYNKWAAGMECLASTFESAGLYSDALAHYEEIDSVFLECLLEKKLPYFNHVGAAAAGDDSGLLLDTSRKDYRDLILRNEISLFDFRCYLFARRAHLLAKMGRISQVMLETPVFLQSIAALLQSETLAPHFLESWTFSSAMDVVEQCQAWLIERGDVQMPGVTKEDVSQGNLRGMTDRIADSQLSTSFHAAKAELLDLARRQLDRIGVGVGHLPRAMPFSLSLPNDGRTAEVKATNSHKITRQELVDILENKEAFDLRYVALAERILAGWNSSARRRNVLRLRCVLASVDYFRKRYSAAWKTFASISEPYAEGQWRRVEAIQLARQLVCHDELKMSRDKAWVNLVLALLRTQGSWRADDEHDDDTDHASTYLNEDRLFSMLRIDSKNSDVEIPISRTAGIDVEVRSQTARLNADNDADGFALSVTVESKASCAISVDDIRVCLSRGSNEEVWYTSGPAVLQPGKNEVRVACVSNGQSGQYVLELTQVRLGKIIFQSILRQSTSLSAAKTFKTPIFITIPQDGDALDFSLDWAPHVFLDRSRTCVLTIATARNAVSELDLRVQLTNGERTIRGLAEAALQTPAQGPQTAKMVADAEKVALTKLEKDARYLIFLPVHEVQGIADGILHLNITVEYRTRQGRNTSGSTKTLKRSAKLALGLPLGVNVQDFFRQDRLLSKFLISAGAAGPLRLANVELWSEEEEEEKGKSAYTIEPPASKAPYIVSADDPASFVFAIRRKASSDKRETGAGASPLRLTLVYRTAHEEALDLLHRSLESLGEGKKWLTASLKRSMSKAMAKQAFEAVNQGCYAREGRVAFHPFDRAMWQKLCRQWCEATSGEGEVARYVDLIKEVLVEAERRSWNESSQPIAQESLDVDSELSWLQEGRRPWRKLSLPVEVPTMTLINAVTMRLDSAQQNVIRVGEPVQATVTIESSFAWNDFAETAEDPAPKETAAPPDEEEDFADAQSDISADERRPAEEKMHVSVDVNCDFVNWLLSGVKRTTVDLPSPRMLMKGGHDPQTAVFKNTVSVTLIALQSGHLALPTVSIWPLTEPLIDQTPPSQAHRRATSQGHPQSEIRAALNASGGAAHMATITSDTYLTNEAQNVCVLPRHAGPNNETFWVTT